MNFLAWVFALTLLQDDMEEQDPPAHAKIVGAATVSPAEARVGDTVKVSLTVEVDPKWHIYAANDKEIATRFEFEEMPVKIAGKIEEPEPHPYPVKALNKTYLVHEGRKVTFVVPLQITDAAKPGELELKGTVGPQVCDDRRCVPWSEEFKVKLKILEGKSTAAPVPVPTPPQEAPKADNNILSGGFLGFLGLAVLGGLVSLIMPCVYPLIPITLTYFVKQGAGNRAKSMGMSMAYAAGIIISFTAIGMILSVVLGGDGARVFAADPWVNLIVGVLFLVFAFSLFGAFEIALPGSITTAVSSPKAGIMGAFVLGLTFSVVTFTCTIPITASLLALAAQGSGAWALFGMLVYSGTMAVPFFLLGLFPGALRNIPKSGGWLHSVKICAAFVELALAVAYFAKSDFSWNVGFISRDFTLIVWTICMTFTALYLLGVFRFREDSPLEHVGITRLVISLLFAGVAVFSAMGLTGKHLGAFEFVQGFDRNPQAINKSKEENWIEDYEKGMAEGKKTGRPILIDFTGFS